MQEICKKWRAGAIKGQKNTSRRVKDAAVKLFPVSRFLVLSGLPDEIRTRLLILVATGKCSIPEMDTKAKAHKTRLRCRSTLLKLVEVDTFEIAMEKYPLYTTERKLEGFYSLFKAARTGKDPPMGFVRYCSTMVEEKKREEELAESMRHAKEGGTSLANIMGIKTGVSATVLKGRVEQLATYASQFPTGQLDRTTLIICDLPYGVTDYDWDVRPTVGDLENYFSAIKAAVMTSKYITVICFAHWEQIREVQQELEKSMCNAGSQVCTWVKANVGMGTGRGLVSNTENFVVGWRTPDGLRERGMFRYLPAETRMDTLVATTCRRFVKGEDGVKVNIAQKPLGLMSYLVTHFSGEGDTVLDLFCGTGMFISITCQPLTYF
jgi:hypothetical protein